MEKFQICRRCKHCVAFGRKPIVRCISLKGDCGNLGKGSCRRSDFVLQYSVSEGYTPLRKHLTEYMKKEHDAGSDNDDILITTGAQQIMDLCSKALVNEGDVVICEAPSFIGSLNTFRSYNAKLAGVPVEPDGMNTEKLGRVLRKPIQTQSSFTQFRIFKILRVLQ